MSATDVLVPGRDVTFTLTKQPSRGADRKTIQRLMRMQPHVQRGLRKLSLIRHRQDNRSYIRAGVPWVARVRTTKLTYVKPGESFTIRLTPQIIPDLKSVMRFLDARSA